MCVFVVRLCQQLLVRQFTFIRMTKGDVHGGIRGAELVKVTSSCLLFISHGKFDCLLADLTY